MNNSIGSNTYSYMKPSSLTRDAGGGIGNRYVPPDDDEKRKKRQPVSEDAKELTEEEKEAASKQAAMQKRFMGIDDEDSAVSGMLMMEKQEIMETFIALTRSVWIDWKKFKRNIEKLLDFLEAELEDDSMFIRFILHRLIRYIPLYDKYLIKIIKKATTDSRLLEHMDDYVRFYAKYMLDQFRDDEGVISSVKSTFKVAYITHPSVNIAAIKEPDSVFKVPINKDTQYEVFYELYQKLLHSGYDVIFVVMPAFLYWAIYHYAVKVSDQFEGKVIVINSGTYGLGLELLMDNVIADVEHLSEDIRSMEMMIKQYKMLVRYWVLPKSYEKISKKQWFRLMIENDMSLPEHKDGKVPIIGLFGNRGISSLEINMEEALNVVSQTVVMIAEQWKQVSDYVLIEYYDQYNEAMDLAKTIKYKCPGVEVSLVESKNEFLKNEFGSYISICMI
jgi:hypothetical protein